MAVMPLEEPRPFIELPIPMRAPATRGTRPPWRPSGRMIILAALIAMLAPWPGSSAGAYLLRPVTVEVASISGNVPVQVFGLGTVAARVQSNVGFKVAGVLVALDADSGDRVPTGSALATARCTRRGGTARPGQRRCAAGPG